MRALVQTLRKAFGLGEIPWLGWIFALQTLATELGFFSLFPILGLLLQRTHGVTLAEVALPVTVFTVAVRAGFLFAPLLQRIGRLKTWLAISLLEAALSFGLLAIVRDLWMVTVALATAGLGISLYLTVVRALIAEEISAPSASMATFALLNLALNVAASVGPLIGSYLLARTMGRMVFGVVAAGYVVGALTIAILVPARTAAQAHGSEEPSRRNLRWSELFEVFVRHARFRRFALANAAGWCFYAQLFATLPLYYAFVHGERSSMGALFTLNAALIVLLQMPVSTAAQRLSSRSERLSLERFLGASYGVFALAFLLIGASGSYVAGFYAAVAVFTLGELVFTPVGHTLVASMGKPGEHLLYFSARGASDALGEGIGVYVGIRVLAALQERGQGYLYWIGLFLLGSVISVLVMHFLHPLHSKSQGADLHNREQELSS